jgi:hypothetical protein
MIDDLPQQGDEDTCPICLMPVLPDEGGCVRHDFAEMVAWGNKYRRDADHLASLLSRARGWYSVKAPLDLRDEIDAALQKTRYRV